MADNHTMDSVRPHDINLVRHLLQEFVQMHRPPTNGQARCPDTHTEPPTLTLTMTEVKTLLADIDRSWSVLSSD